MKFQEITTDQDWSEAVALRNIYNWSHPIRVAEERSFYERSRHERNDVRLLGRIDGKTVTYSVAMLNRNAGKETYWFGVYHDPHGHQAQHVFRTGIGECLERIKGFWWYPSND